MDLIFAARQAGWDSHYISIGFLDSEGAERSLTFLFTGRSVDRRLRELSRIGRTPIQASAADAEKLASDVPKTVVADPLKTLMAGVPLWDARQVAFEASMAGFQLSPDGAVALADGALSEVATGRLLGRLPSMAGTSAFSPDGRVVVAANNDGAINDEGASRAGAFTVVDVPDARLRRRVGELPWLGRWVLSADSTRVFAELSGLGGREHALSAMALDSGETAWRSALPEDRVSAVLPWPGGVYAHGVNWVGVWNGSTGDQLYGPAAVLQDLDPGERPYLIRDVRVLGIQPRLLVVYAAKGHAGMAEVEMSSGKTLRSIHLLDDVQPGHQWATFFSPDSRLVLVWSRDRTALWNMDTLSLVGTLTGQRDLIVRKEASFDASGRRIATAVRYTHLERTHVVVWDTVTRSAIGQCLLEATDSIRMSPGGDAVLAPRGRTIAVCSAPSASTRGSARPDRPVPDLPASGRGMPAAAGER